MENQTLRNQPSFSEDELARRAQFDRSRPLERDEGANLISSAKSRAPRCSPPMAIIWGISTM